MIMDSVTAAIIYYSATGTVQQHDQGCRAWGQVGRDVEQSVSLPGNR